MLSTITISHEDILQQIKLSCQLPAAVERVASRKMIVSVAHELGIQVKPEELQQAADQFRICKRLKTAEETWTWLAKYGLTINEFEEIAYINVLSAKLADHLLSDRVESFWTQHQLDYAEAVLYEVVLDDPDLAIELYAELQQGAISFYEIAHQYSQDQELRRSGGYRGIVRHQELPPEVSAVVFATQPPQFLKPIVTAQGVHLIWVEELIQPPLDDGLHAQILAELFSEWLQQRIREIEVIWQLDSRA
jgi:parvulin-like peptidyl-prolyl isomerase